MTTPEPIIRLEEVSKAFNGQVVLDRLNLDFYPGKTTVVIGPSGCGKTVLLKHVNGLLKPDSGRVYFHGEDTTGLSERQLARIRSKIGFLFQGGALFDSMTVEENVCFPMVEHSVSTPAGRLAKCEEVLALVGMGGTRAKFPEELSGGQKKRVALARAIVLDPEVILYDEPTTGLDPIRADLINELILKLQQALHTTTIVVTHDMSSARKVADRIVMLYEGRIVADGKPESFDRSDSDIVQRFIQGRASEEELAELHGNNLRPGPKPAGADQHSESLG